MFLFDNPVLQRELLGNLRSPRSFVLLAAYQLFLAGIVLAAWPADGRLDLTTNPPSARKLVDLFFLGQYVIASLMAPSFAAGAIAGEKERQTYEMLLASPLRPAAIVSGKLIASLTHLGLLIIASLPIIVLCLPLGGVSVYEVLAAYTGLVVSVILFGTIALFCGSHFSRTGSALVVSYLIILPLVMGAVLFWRMLAADGQLRLQLTLLVIPAYALAAVILMAADAAGRMLYPPDFGSEGKPVIDPEREAAEAVGLVIQPDQFPDRLFAPPKKQELMPDGTNPVYDKELHSEIFSQGTLMLRLVIQISMLLAIPLMGVFLFWLIDRCIWFPAYAIIFNLLVGPVFLAGSMTGERERQTLDLLLTTPLSPWQILSGKFVVGFRVSGVLTAFLLWPLVLASLLNNVFWGNWAAVLGMFAIVFAACLVNSVVALTASLFQRRTVVALVTTYATLLVLYVGPPAAEALATLFDFSPEAIAGVRRTGIGSPFSALAALPLDEQLNLSADDGPANVGDLAIVGGYFAFAATLIGGAYAAMFARLSGRRDGI